MLKYVLFVLAIAILAWWWTSRRRAIRLRRTQSRPAVTDLVQCNACGDYAVRGSGRCERSDCARG